MKIVCVPTHALRIFFLSLLMAVSGVGIAAQAPPAISSVIGTIQAIHGTTIVLQTDQGNQVTVQTESTTKFLQIAPGQKDLKSATPIALSDLQTGDRVLVRGKQAEDGKSVEGLAIVAMKKSDVAEKQSKEREEWAKNGVGGLVKSVDAANGTITISTNANQELTVKTTKATVLRRYAANSVKYEDAKAGTINDVKPGDQLRARGPKNEAGTELTADEVISGSFRNIAGLVNAVDAANETITVQDLISKKPVTVKITSDSQLRTLPAPMAQRLAARLKAGANGSGAGAPANAAPGNGQGGGPGGGGMGARRPGGGDLQQLIARLPEAKVSDLQKGAAVMIVGTSDANAAESSAIILLNGVEPILEASPKGASTTVLSPWNLGSGEEGGGNQ